MPDEALVREIAASRIPVITGIGHEVDESLADLAADIRVSTPSNAAEILTHDKAEEKAKLRRTVMRAKQALINQIEQARQNNRTKVGNVSRGLMAKYIEPMLTNNREKMTKLTVKLRDEFDKRLVQLRHKVELLNVLNPEKVLKHGYAILSGKISPGMLIKITTMKQEINAEVKEIHERGKA